MRIAIVEDHSLTRTGIRSSLNEQQDISVVGEAETGVAGLKLLQKTKPDRAIRALHRLRQRGYWLARYRWDRSCATVSEYPSSRVRCFNPIYHVDVLHSGKNGAGGFCSRGGFLLCQKHQV